MIRSFHFFLALIFSLNVAHAAIHYVSPTGVGDGSSWGSSANLHTALSTAAFGDEIWISSGGNYLATVSGNRQDSFVIATANLSLFGGFSGTESSVNERDPILNPTVISGDIGTFGVNTDNSFTILLMNAANITLDGLQFVDGFGDGSGTLETEGGAIYLSSQAENTMIRQCLFMNNFAGHGGAISNRNTSNSQNGYLNIENCVFDNNSTNNSAGALHAMGPTRIVHCIFHENQTTTNAGGAIVLNAASISAAFFVYNSTFINNSATGNAAHLWSDAPILNIQNSIFEGGTSSANYPIYQSSGTMTTYNSIVPGGNVAGSWSGGFYGTDGFYNLDVSAQFSDNLNAKGPDNRWFTEDDGLRLQASSPAIDAGITHSEASKDVLGKGYFNAPDLGAYEFMPIAPALNDYAGFAPLNKVVTNKQNQIALIWDMDTTSVGYSGNITEMVFEISWMDPSIDFTSALVYDLSAGNLVSNSPVFSSTNISFSGLNYPLSSSSNSVLELKVSTGTSFASANVHFEIKPSGIILDGGLMATGNPIASGNIPLVDPFQGLSFAAGPNPEPTSFTRGDNNIALIDMDFDLINGSSSEVIEKLKIHFTEGFVPSDVSQFSVWIAGSKVGELDNIGSSFATNTNLGIEITSLTNVEIRANIESGATAANLSYNVNSSTVILGGGNVLEFPSSGIANLGSINDPMVLSMLQMSPAHNSMYVPVGANLIVLFDEPLSSIATGSVRIYEEGVEVFNLTNTDPEISTMGANLIIDLNTDLMPSSNYQVSIDPDMIAGLISGNTFAGFDASQWTFSTNGTSQQEEMSNSMARKLTAAHSAIYALDPLGNLFAEGDNSFAQIDGNLAQSVTGAPQIAVGLDFDDICAGAEHLMALKNGQVYMTGSNIFGQSQGKTQLSPVPGLGNIDLIAAGAYSSFAYDKTNDSLYAWGNNDTGILGTGNMNDEMYPTVINKPSGNVSAISAGAGHMLVIINGHIYGTGEDRNYQLASGGSSNTLFLVDGSRQWKAVAAGGFHTLGLSESGNVYTFGRNHNGQLGLGFRSGKHNAPSLLENIPPVKAVAAGMSHSAILCEDGTIYTFGSNREGQLGGFGGIESYSLFNPGGYNDVTDIACGPYTTLFKRNDGSMEYVKVAGKINQTNHYNFLVFKSFPMP